MQKKIAWMGLMLLMVNSLQVGAQFNKEDSLQRKCFVGSSLFVLMNFVPDNNPPNFVQLNLGYRIAGRQVISLEVKTWKYGWPIGIPWGKSFEAEGEGFPGFIREFGFAVAYQYFWWKGLYTGMHAMCAWQSFVGLDGQRIGKGFQVFNTYRLGYHLKLFHDRWFIQPSVAITHRPYHTRMPESFKMVDDRWSKFFFGEPGLHFGFVF